MFDFLKNLATKTDVKTNSDSGELNKKDWKAILQSTAIVAIGAAAAYLANNLGGLELGDYTVIIVPMVTSALVAIQKWASSNSK